MTIKILRVVEATHNSGTHRIFGDDGVLYLTRNLWVACRLKRCAEQNTPVIIGSNAGLYATRWIHSIKPEGCEAVSA